MRLKKLDKLYFSTGNVCVDGLRGRGKDMLMSNIIARRNAPYISNVDYCAYSKKRKGNVYIPLNLKALDCKNNYHNLLNGDIIPYEYPYPENVDIWISDSQVYFPSQYNGNLDKLYPNIPNFLALSRQLGNVNVHCNTQNLNRLWLKLREQSDMYLKCNKIRVFKSYVFQWVTVYDNHDSCVARVKPFKPLRCPLWSNRESRAMYRTKNFELKRKFEEQYGTVKKHLLIYRNISKYDTRIFKTILKGGKIDYEEND